MDKNTKNPYAPGPVKVWKMTKKALEAYIEKHPIIYREELKPSPTFRTGNARFYIKAKSTDQFNRYRAALTRELVREEPYYRD
ncbi:hypothetical protein [Bacillus cereus]